jgi:hypothetical protein
MMVDVPSDILYLITNVIGELAHPRSYTIDTASLHALSLVSRLFNTLATPILYSTIMLSDHHSVGCLLSTAESNPKLLKLCHSLYWPGWRLSFVEHKILSAMTGLRRFFTSQKSGRPLETLPNSTMAELVFPGVSFEELCHRRFCTHTFDNLERLVIESITYSQDLSLLTHLLKMPRLTHVAIAKINLQYPDLMIAVIKHTPPLCRIIFGPSTRTILRFEYNAFWSRIHELLLERRDTRVVFLGHDKDGDWFRDHLVDGTLWEMDSTEPFEGH